MRVTERHGAEMHGADMQAAEMRGAETHAADVHAAGIGQRSGVRTADVPPPAPARAEDAR